MDIQTDYTRQIVQELAFLADEISGGQPAETQAGLEILLDRLALAYHLSSREAEPATASVREPTQEEYEQLRAILAKRFPLLGLYRSSSLSPKESTSQGFLTGDALDDLVDIVRDMREVNWRWSNNGKQDAIWHFRWGYEHHWGEHLRDLQRYLYLQRFISA